MAYTPVTRVVTIEFRELALGRWEILLTPDPVTVRFRDSIRFEVRGLAPALAGLVSVGNFVALDTPAVVRRAGRVLMPVRPRLAAVVRSIRTGVIVDLGRTEVGFYKYDILFDGRTIADPELEIRGPRA
jgi:hypothetical protein